MSLDQKIIERFDKLIEDGNIVINTGRIRSTSEIAYWGDNSGYSQLSHQWGVSCLSLLGRVLGKDGDHYRKFDGLFDKFEDYTPAKNALGILKGAKEDYEGGYLFRTRTLIEAEVFDEFLEQAEHLLAVKYYGPAAVIGGSVLEDGLRKLCQRHNLPLSASATS